MANLLLIAALLATSPGNASALKGAEADQQLAQFRQDYIAQARAGGKPINNGEFTMALRTKAQSLITGISPDTVPAEEGLAWSHVFDAADKYTESITLLKRYLTTSPSADETFQAKLAEAHDYQRLPDIDASGAILKSLAPTDDKTATQLASADSIQGRYMGQKDSKKGIAFIDQVAPQFEKYPTAQKLLDREKSSLKMDITRDTLTGGDAPELTILSDKYGDYTNLASLKGKVVILDFFAHWCPPCKASFPSMKKLEEELGDKAVFVGVTEYYGYYGKDKGISQADEFKDMKQFMTEYGIDHSVVYVDKSQFASYGVSGIPEFVIIGKDGKVKKVTLGYSPQLFQQFHDAAVEAAQ